MFVLLNIYKKNFEIKKIFVRNNKENVRNIKLLF